MNKPLFQSTLLSWFDQHKRDLPWRRTKDPYKIWVSEIMLQQTQVATVIPYYKRWIQQFPTPQAVAEASEDNILKAWEGLGYYSRVRNFQQACREIVDKYDGKVPDTLKEIQQLPGIGRYTAGAILSIAYDQAVPLVDGNVIRVLSRLFAIRKDPKKNSELFWELAESLVPQQSAGDFNQALMELGATVCTPVNPACLICPIGKFCQAKKQGIQNRLPFAPQRQKSQVILLASALIQKNGKILLCRRENRAHLKGMWEPPTVLLIHGEKAELKLADYFAQNRGAKIKISGKPRLLRTTRTHYRLHFQLFQAEFRSGSIVGNSRTTNHEQQTTVSRQLGYPTDLSSAQWIPIEQFSILPLPGVWAKHFSKFVTIQSSGLSCQGSVVSCY